jgi:putative RecB family exonuclease
VETDLSKHGLPTLIGILDLVRAGGRIVDFKTTGKTPDREDAIHLNEAQLSCYSVSYRDATGHSESARELHHLVKTKTPKLVITEIGPMDGSQQIRLFKMIDSYVEGLARQDFVPSPGFGCMGCEYWNECRRWS